MAAGVASQAGRVSADVIQRAQARHLPLLTVAEASRRAGITREGWAKVIRTGRGHEGTFIAMARVVGVETEVRAALGLPPLDANVIPLPVQAESAEDVALRAVMEIIRDESPQLTDHERRAALNWLHRPEARELLRAKLAKANLTLARQG